MQSIVLVFYLFVPLVYGRHAAEWRSRSIYQLLTDRFSPSNFSYDRCVEQPFSEQAIRNYCGGTYRGAIDQLDYIAQMGFNAIWISPIPSNLETQTKYGIGFHGYWLRHLYQLNEHFGSEQDLIDFVTAAHQRDIWVMLDVVANHVAPNLTTDYFPFEQPEHFHQPPCLIKDYNNQTQVEFCSLGSEDLPLPDLNTENPFVIATFASWINETVRKYKFDGIRIDTFRHVGKPFWKDYIRSAGVYSLGEVYVANTSYVGSYQKVADGVFHYPLYFVLKLVFTDDDRSRQSMASLENQVKQNQIYLTDSTLCGVFLDNHDQDRFLNHTQNRTRIANALVYLMFSDGIPIVYMGTEQNFTGNPNVENGATDPWNRAALWRSGYDRSNWIYNYLKKLNQIRSSLKKPTHNNDDFFQSHQQTIFVDQNTYVYKKGPLLVVVSNQPFNTPKNITLPSHLACKAWRNLLSGKAVKMNGCSRFQIDSWQPILLSPV